VHAAAFQADQGDPAASEPLIQKVVAVFGRLDILVNNAAIARQGKTIDDPDIDNAEMDRQWMINTMGVVSNIRAAAKVLPEDALFLLAADLAPVSPFQALRTMRPPKPQSSATRAAPRATWVIGELR
jgi:NAD(P)-dependent dehydrogenase (short-subunit alcohol dehydrogenase family)